MSGPAWGSDVSKEDRAIFNLMFFLEHYFPNSELIKRAKNDSRLRIAGQIGRCASGRVTPVERVRDISPEDFQRRFLSRGIPVVIEGGAARWDLMSRWSFSEFARRFGAESIKLVQRKGLSDDDWIDEREYSEEIVFADFLSQVQGGGRKYMRFSPLLEKFPELLDDFDHAFFRRMIGNDWGTTYQLFIGGKGTFTPIHNAMTPFFFVNVCGVKRWALVPCQYLALLDPSADGFGYNHSEAEVGADNAERYPGFDAIDRLEAVMEPGDLLHVPSWMWHSVQNESATIGVRCGFVYPRGMLRGSLTLTLIRLFAARNPSTLEALYYSIVKPNLPTRDNWLVTPRLFRHPVREEKSSADRGSL